MSSMPFFTSSSKCWRGITPSEAMEHSANDFKLPRGEAMAWAGIYCILVVLSRSDCDPELCNSPRQVMGNGEENNMLYQKFLSFRGHHSISGGRGGGLKFLSWRNYLFQPGSAARQIFQIFTKCLSCLYRTYGAKIIYLSQSLLEIIQFENIPLPPPPPLEFEWSPPYAMVTLPGCISHMNEVWFYHRLLAEYKALDPHCPMFEEYRQHPHLW